MLCWGSLGPGNDDKKQPKFLSQNEAEVVKRLSEVTKFSASELAELYTEFLGMVDIKEKDKGISKMNFTEKIKILNNNYSVMLADKIFNAIDKVSQEHVSFAEFVSYLNTLYYGDQIEKLNFSFRIMDTNNKGYLTREDMFNTFKILININAILTGEAETAEEEIHDFVEFVMSNIDRDHNDQIDFDEFCNSAVNKRELFDVFEVLNGSVFKNKLRPQNIDKDIREIVEDMKVIQTEYSDLIEMVDYPDQARVSPILKSPMIRPVVARADLEGEIEDAKIYTTMKPLQNLTKLLHEGDSRNSSRRGSNRPGSVPAIKDSSHQHFNYNQGGYSYVPNEFIPRMRKLSEIIDLVAGKVNKKFGKEYPGKKPEDEEDKAHLPPNLLEKNKKAFDSARKGSLVFVFKESWDLVFCIMVGTFKAVKSLYDNKFYQINALDYKTKSSFDIPAMTKYQNFVMCRFFDYAPYIFNSIRQRAGISSEKYLSSIGPERLVTGLLTGDVSTLAELCSPGKSGSFLYFTYDGNFIMKTISRAEYRTMLSTLRDYHDYLVDNPDSLITRYFGLHKIVMTSRNLERKTYYFVMMKNIFRTQKPLRYKFDLKGSTYKREYPLRDPSKDVSSHILKDLNWVSLGLKLDLEEGDKWKLIDTIRKDSQFLNRINIIDYSLLIGVIEYRPSEDDAANSSFTSSLHQPAEYQATTVHSRDRKTTYLMGIIDTFTHFGAFKKCEALFKRCLQGKGVSCVHPDKYAARFADFVERQFK